MISKIADFNNVNKFNLENNQYKKYYFNSLYACDTVSFGNTSPILKSMLDKKQNAVSDYSKIASDFGIELLKDTEISSHELLKSKIQEFLKSNGINNIEIKNINEHPDKNVHSIAGGCFVPKINDDLQGIKGGTLYVSDLPQNKDDKNAITTYIAFVCHELTHALQYSKDKTGFGFDNEINSINEANRIFAMINNLKPRILQDLQMNPLQNLVANYNKFNLSKDDVTSLIQSINNYHMPLLNKSININDDFVAKSVSPNCSLKEKVNGIADVTINNFIKYNNIPEEKQTLIKRAILKRYIFEFQTEREAYNTACEILKQQYNIQGNIVYDMVPSAYKMVEDILSEKLKTEEL